MLECPNFYGKPCKVLGREATGMCLSKLIPAARRVGHKRGNVLGMHFTRPVSGFSRTVISLPSCCLATSRRFWLGVRVD